MRYGGEMHTHFGSATNLVGTFLGVLLIGTFWKLAWMHVLSAGMSRNNKALQGTARAALFQFGG